MRRVNFILNRVHLFDIDGTLTPHRQSIDPDFLEFFLHWSSNNKFYLTTGSDLIKVKEQLPAEVLNQAAGIFCCMGNQLFAPGADKVVYQNEFEPSRELIKDLQLTLGYSDFPYPWREGPHIELRPGMLNFSVAGRGVDAEMRKLYSRFDSKTRERERTCDIIRNKYPHLDASIGGEISIDIYLRGNDKSQSVRYILNHEQPHYIIFIGDRAFEGGNDYAVCKELDNIGRGVWFNISNWKETKAILNSDHLYTNRDGVKA